jgi:hypothetical protein
MQPHDGAVAAMVTELLFWGMALIGLYLLFARLGKYLTRKTGIRSRVYWGVLGGGIGCLLIGIGAEQYHTFRKDRQANLRIAQDVASRLTPQRITNLSSDPCLQSHQKGVNLVKENCLRPQTLTHIDTIFTPEIFSEDTDVRMFIPLTGDDFLFVWQNSRFRYADVRPIQGNIDADAMRLMLATKQDYLPSFIDQVMTRFDVEFDVLNDSLVGLYVKDQEEHLVALVLMYSDKIERYPLFS